MLVDNFRQQEVNQMLLANLFHSLFYTSARFLSCNKSPLLARPEVFHLILEKSLQNSLRVLLFGLVPDTAS